MKTEFRKAVLPRELRSLVLFDSKIFSSDRFRESEWKAYDAYWLVVDGNKVGCCAFQEDVTFPNNEGVNPDCKGSLYIASTGILPRFQRMGFGHLLKTWQTAYARRHGFTRIRTTTRKRNAAMIALNQKHGFKVVRTIRQYYSNPTDSGVMMELHLPGLEKARAKMNGDPDRDRLPSRPRKRGTNR